MARNNRTSEVSSSIPLAATALAGHGEPVNPDSHAKPAVQLRASRTCPEDGHVTDLGHTSEAAKALGLSARSIARWAAEGRITPDVVTPGGHMRWDIDNLRRQRRDLRSRSQ